MASHRPDRVGDQIRQELSELLSRGAVHDPGIGFITLTQVKLSPDLQLARVFYTTLGDDAARRETAKALERATGFFRRHLGERLRLRRVPELQFQFDESVGHQDRVEQILRELHEEDERRKAAAAESAGDGPPVRLTALPEVGSSRDPAGEGVDSPNGESDRD
jgi:ribosome-binding factor A